MKLEIELLDTGSFLYKNHIIAPWANGDGWIFYDVFEAKTNIPLVLNRLTMKDAIEEINKVEIWDIEKSYHLFARAVKHHLGGCEYKTMYGYIVKFSSDSKGITITSSFSDDENYDNKSIDDLCIIKVVKKDGEDEYIDLPNSQKDLNILITKFINLTKN